ncbi:uncharacterized protein MONBRDRAFT_13057 [Monosiga brevicollis MX1]|uniref:Uncharacterized protein n=1 Tax=Monosiga brevicollis TaxID=81824 RepID=A9VE61_MONBE|nr:uncharacterized protein MONBRDRAFT_13057 [Monosiga brevicollis MX1]EDQ84183.1 predicted protein [Monosiga brevicollis MX1]|eukprot:XP_001751013.1 hypothetical protein [Monosiga brevicollis MX1]
MAVYGEQVLPHAPAAYWKSFCETLLAQDQLDWVLPYLPFNDKAKTMAVAVVLRRDIESELETAVEAWVADDASYRHALQESLSKLTMNGLRAVSQQPRVAAMVEQAIATLATPADGLVPPATPGQVIFESSWTPGTSPAALSMTRSPTIARASATSMVPSRSPPVVLDVQADQGGETSDVVGPAQAESPGPMGMGGLFVTPDLDQLVYSTPRKVTVDTEGEMDDVVKPLPRWPELGPGVAVGVAANPASPARRPLLSEGDESVYYSALPSPISRSPPEVDVVDYEPAASVEPPTERATRASTEAPAIPTLRMSA